MARHMEHSSRELLFVFVYKTFTNQEVEEMQNDVTFMSTTKANGFASPI